MTSKCQSVDSADRIFIIQIEIENLTTFDISGASATASVGVLKEAPYE